MHKVYIIITWTVVVMHDFSLSPTLRSLTHFKEEISFTFCGSVVPVPPPIYSTSNVLTLTLKSNEVIEGPGYSAFASRTTCPNVTWVAEDVGSVSSFFGLHAELQKLFGKNADVSKFWQPLKKKTLGVLILF